MKRIKTLLLAFFVSVLLWSLATSQNLSKESFFVNLNILDVPQDYIISKNSVRKLNIEVGGPKSLISKLASYDFRAEYKLPSSIIQGAFSFNVSPDDISSPSGVEVKSVSPSNIRIFLEKLERRVLNIKPNIIGEPATGFRRSRVDLYPSNVTVKGPKNILENLIEISTETPFDITGLQEPSRQRVRLVLEDDNLFFVDIQHTTIRVFVEPIIVTKRLENVSVITTPVEVKTRMIPKTFTADFRGPLNLIEKIIQPGITAVIDIRDLGEGTQNLLVPEFPDLPPDIQVIDRNPKKITVKILKVNDE